MIVHILTNDRKPPIMRPGRRRTTHIPPPGKKHDETRDDQKPRKKRMQSFTEVRHREGAQQQKQRYRWQQESQKRPVVEWHIDGITSVQGPRKHDEQARQPSACAKARIIMGALESSQQEPPCRGQQDKRRLHVEEPTRVSREIRPKVIDVEQHGHIAVPGRKRRTIEPGVYDCDRDAARNDRCGEQARIQYAATQLLRRVKENKHPKDRG